MVFQDFIIIIISRNKIDYIDDKDWKRQHTKSAGMEEQWFRSIKPNYPFVMLHCLRVYFAK